jgi:hypothetical protein
MLEAHHIGFHVALFMLLVTFAGCAFWNIVPDNKTSMTWSIIALLALASFIAWMRITRKERR